MLRIGRPFLLLSLLCSTTGFLAGCGKIEVSTSSSTSGSTGSTQISGSEDSLQNKNGVGKGTVGGVTIEVREPGDGTAGISHSSSASTALSGETVRDDSWDISLGDVEIRMESLPDDQRSLKINGEDYGTVSTGDALLIDEQRRVTVNGEALEPVSP